MLNMLSWLTLIVDVSAVDPPTFIIPCSHEFSGTSKYLEWDAAASAYVTNEFELDGKVEYDLSILQLRTKQATGGAGYTVQDENMNSVNRKYEYIFNICGEILNFDTLNLMDKEHLGEYTNYTVGQKCRHDMVATKDIDGCPSNVNGEELCQGLGLGPGFQYQRSDVNQQTKCYRLGRVDKKESEYACGESGNRRDCMNWMLINKDDPTAGVILEYDGGDTCDVKDGDVNIAKARKLRLYFECDPNDVEGNIPDEELITEREVCTYDIHIASRYGCPSNCPYSDGSICNSRGYCKWDRSIASARCYCDEGYTGDSCSSKQKKSSSISAAGVSLIIISVFFVLVLGVLYFVVKQIRSLRDPSNYTMFNDGESGGNVPMATMASTAGP